MYIDFWRQTLETESLQSWNQVALDQPGSIKSFAPSRSALHSLPLCAVPELIAIGVKAELAPEDILSGKGTCGANSDLQTPQAQTLLNNKMALTVKLENFTAKMK